MMRAFAPWVILGSIIGGVVLFVAVAFVIWWKRPTPTPANIPPAAVFVVTLPTETPPPATPTVIESPEQTNTPLPLPPAGELAIGAHVQITGTGGDGLRLRTEPGLEAQVRSLGAELEEFQVRDGPHQADGYTWWYLVAVHDEARTGWAVSNYLLVVQNP